MNGGNGSASSETSRSFSGSGTSSSILDPRQSVAQTGQTTSERPINAIPRQDDSEDLQEARSGRGVKEMFGDAVAYVLLGLALLASLPNLL